MKNPIKPNLKTELFPVLMILTSFLAAFYFTSVSSGELMLSFNRSGDSLHYIAWSKIFFTWPITILVIYLMFLLFPYFKINHQEGVNLRKVWHRNKELSLSFFFILQIINFLTLSGDFKKFLPALLILFALFIFLTITAVIRVLKSRQLKPLSYGK